jgi:probable HAF family extracellular repeat protein
MKSATLIWIARLAAGAALTMPQVWGQEGQEHQGRIFPGYRVIDLGTLGGAGTNSAGFGMNETGWVAGSSNLVANGPQHAFLWRRDHMIDLGTLGGPNSGASVVNARGEVALSSETEILDPYNEDFCASPNTHYQCIAGIWNHGKLQALPLLMQGHNSQAYGINDQGRVSGFAETDREEAEGYCATPFQRFDYKAVIWEPNGDIRELEPLSGDTVSFSWGINRHGQAIGGSGSCSDTILPPNVPSSPHAVLWEKDRTPVDLGSLGTPPAGTPPLNIASAINNRGEVVGGSLVKDGTVHQFLWTSDTGMQDLGTFPGALATVFPCCNTINDSRQIVGFTIDQGGNSRAILWQNYIWMDLNNLIPKHSGWTLQAAESINDAGQITGFGVINGEVHAFLATPRDRDPDEYHDR